MKYIFNLSVSEIYQTNRNSTKNNGGFFGTLYLRETRVFVLLSSTNTYFLRRRHTDATAEE